MSLDPVLLEVLVCPEDKGPLMWFESEQLLYNPRLRRGYRVRDGIPVMLIDEALDVDAAEHDRLMRLAATTAVLETGRGTSAADRAAHATTDEGGEG